MATHRDRLMRDLTNLYDEDRIIPRLNPRPGDGDGYVLESMNFSHYMALSAWNAADRYAVSWRGFYVGGVALGATERFKDLVFLHGANIKTDEQGAINEHAEDIILGKARKYGCQILSMVIVGNTQPDHASGLHTATLQPCGRCRDRMAEAPDVITPRTTLFSTSPDRRTYEMYGLEALRQLHQTGDPNTPGIWRFDVPNMDMWHDITIPIFYERLQQLDLAPGNN